MSRPRVVVTSGEVPQAALDLLATECEVVTCPELPCPTRADILRRVPGASALFWFSKERLDAEVLEAAGPQMRVVSTMSAGYDQVDVRAARCRGVQLGHTPEVLAAAVAEVAVLLALAAARRLTAGQRAMRAGKWETGRPQWLLGQDMVGATAGIVGFGGVGQALAQRIRGFQFGRILYAAPRPKEAAAALGVKRVELDALLQDSDFVFACCPLLPETERLFNSAAFERMKRSAVFVNVGRGGLVDQDALVKALRSGDIFAAGLDVMTPEPLLPDHELYDLENCVLLPHIGSATERTRREMALLAARNILDGLKGKKMPAPIP